MIAHLFFNASSSALVKLSNTIPLCFYYSSILKNNYFQAHFRYLMNFYRF